jgi:tRNA nucleotidyltransferase (CCA-adding enzyme)
MELLHLLAYQAALLRMPLYLVGGVVRDILLGRAVNDFDLVVEGSSAEFAEYIVRKFGGKILIHSKFMTATWVVNETTFKRLNVPAHQLPDSPLSFDLVSARSETYAQPGALPTVKRSTIDDDLRRRDFSINAMAFRLDGDHFGELHDPLAGQKDLENKLMRVLHDRSFVDDPTRIFRAARYAARYGFEIDSETVKLINKESLGVLDQLSGERLRHEFDLIFEESHSLAMVADLEVFGVLRAIHPDLQFSNYKPTYDYQLSDELSDFVFPDILTFHQTLAWVIWLISLPVTSIEAIAKRLAFPSVLTTAAVAASKIHLTPYPPGSNVSQKTFYFDAFPPLAIYAAWIMANDKNIQKILSDYLLDWRNVKPYTTGYTLQQRGLEPGPKFKELLTRLRAAWLDGEVQTEDEEKQLLEKLL